MVLSVRILALSSLLRLYHINFQSLWIDELYSIILTIYDELVGRITCAFIGLLGIVAMYFFGKNQKSKYLLPLILLLGFVVNMLFFKKHYTRIQKSQFREAGRVVLTENRLHDPIYSSLPRHFNFYFRKSKA